MGGVTPSTMPRCNLPSSGLSDFSISRSLPLRGTELSRWQGRLAPSIDQIPRRKLMRPFFRPPSVRAPLPRVNSISSNRAEQRYGLTPATVELCKLRVRRFILFSDY